MTTKPDIMLTKLNIATVVSDLLSGVQTCCNKKRESKKSELYLRCGGGYDTESTTVTDDTGKPLFAFVYHVQICINGQYMYFRDIQLIVPFFIELCHAVKAMRTKKKQPKLIIWVANLAHEYAFFKRQLAIVGITDLFAKEERQPIKIELQGCIELRECLGLFGNSLEKVAKDYTTTQKLKGDLQYDLIRGLNTPLSSDEYNYCKNDVVILDELSEVAFTKFTDNQLKIPMTFTGILRQRCKAAIKNIKYEYAANAKLMPHSEYDYYTMRKYLYAGGLSGTNCLYVGQYIEKAKCADVTSDYPAQMNHMLYPAGELIECTPAEILQHKGQFRILLFTCDLSAKTSHAVLSKHKVLNMKKYATQEAPDDYPETGFARSVLVENGKIQYGENLCLMLNNTDIAAYRELYNITNIKIMRCWYFTKKAKAPKFLLDCMNHDYLAKQTLKAAGKKYTEEKKAVNSYYGMTATKLYDCMYGYNELLEDIDEMSSDLSYEQQRKRMWLSPYIGYWCTSYARALLMHFISRFPDVVIQYDTDSLYYITDENKVPKERIQAFEKALKQYNMRIKLKNMDMFKNDSHFDDLGTWEIDKDNLTGFKGLGAKRYLKRKKDGTLNPVVAGMVKSSFAEYVEKTGIDPFELFDDDLKLDRVTSKKLASAYYDGITKQVIIDGKVKKVPDLTAPDKAVKITDYLGNTEIVTIGTYHALYNIEFSMKVAAEYVEFSQMLSQEKALPAKYRQYENFIDDWRLIKYA